MDILIRKINKQDATAVSLIEKECFSVPWNEKNILSEIELPETYFIIAECGETIVGYGSMRCTKETSDINNIAVKSEFRKKGIGKSLLEGLIDESKSRGIDEMFLEVRSSNIPAISLYKSMGFKEIHIRKNYYSKPTENAIVFQLNLK